MSRFDQVILTLVWSVMSHDDGKRNLILKCREAKQTSILVFCTTPWLNRVALTPLLIQSFFISLWPFICTLRMHEVSGSEANSFDYTTTSPRILNIFIKVSDTSDSDILDYCVWVSVWERERERDDYKWFPYFSRIIYRQDRENVKLST